MNTTQRNIWLLALGMAVGLLAGKVFGQSQGDGAKALMRKVAAQPVAVDMGPPAVPSALVLPPRPWFFAATATATNGLTSEFSKELVWANTNQARQVTLGWDASGGQNERITYAVHKGQSSRAYSNSYSAGTNLVLTVPLYPPAKSNFVWTVTSVNATNLQWAAALAGPWFLLGKTNYTATNGPGRFWRALGRKATTKGKAFIAGRWE